MKHRKNHKSPKKISQHGFTQWVILIVLMIGIGVGVWVAQIRTNLAPQAAVVPPIQATEMTITQLSPMSTKTFDIAINVRSDLDSARLVTAHLKYDPQVLQIVKINYTPVASDSGVIYATASAIPQQRSQVSQWLETLFDNKTGNAAVTGLYGAGDLKTEVGKESVRFVTISMKAKTLTKTEVKVENTSLILRAADNANILTKTEDLILEPAPATPSGSEK